MMHYDGFERFDKHVRLDFEIHPNICIGKLILAHISHPLQRLVKFILKSVSTDLLWSLIRIVTF